MDAQHLSGVWTHTSLFPAEPDFMWFDESRQRVIDFVSIQVEPRKRAPIRAWFRLDAEDKIATRLRPDGVWTVHDIAFHGELLHLTTAGVTHVLGRLPPSDCPDWLESALAIANVKMDEMEKTG